jgi:hypothetical protein
LVANTAIGASFPFTIREVVGSVWQSKQSWLEGRSALNGPTNKSQQRMAKMYRTNVLHSAVVTIGALKRGIIFVYRMRKLQSLRAQLVNLVAAALRQNQMACVAVIGFDRSLPDGRDMFSVMAPETARPILVADIVRVSSPIGFHFREEIISVNLLHGSDGRVDARVLRVGVGQSGGDALHGAGLICIRAAQDSLGVGLDVWQGGIDMTEGHRQIDRAFGRLELVAGRLWQSMQSIVRSGKLAHVIGELGRVELGYDPLRIGHAHPGDFLARRVGGNVLNLVGHVHVPMDAPDRPVRRIAPAYFKQ